MKIDKGNRSADCDHFCPEIKQHFSEFKEDEDNYLSVYKGIRANLHL